MSGNILTYYANSLDHAGANLNQAYAQQIAEMQSHANRTSQNLSNLQQIIKDDQAQKLEKQKLENEKEAQAVASEEANKFLNVLAVADSRDEKGNPIGTNRAMQIVNNQYAQARAERAKNRPANLSSLETIALGGAAALGVGGKWAWDKGKQGASKLAKAYNDHKTSKAESASAKDFLSEQARLTNQPQEIQAALAKGYDELKKIDQKQGTNFASQYLADQHQASTQAHAMIQNLAKPKPLGSTAKPSLAQNLTAPAPSVAQATANAFTTPPAPQNLGSTKQAKKPYGSYNYSAPMNYSPL